jgi:enediyne biosynthesis protein E4
MFFARGSQSILTRSAAIGTIAVVLIALAIGYGVPQLLKPEIPTWAQPQPDRAPDECDPPQAPSVSAGPGYFTDITDEVGIDFQHVVGPLGTYFMPESVGAGGGLFDYDNDGDLDLFLVNGGKSPKASSEFPPGTRLGNRLFRQEASGKFADVTDESGLGATDFGIGCAIGDIDNDGYLDVYVTNYGPDRMFRNNGNGTFSDITDATGIDNPDWGTGAVFFDYDRDGRLDLFVVNYTSDPIYGHSVACGFYHGRVSYCGPLKFQPTVDRLFHNDGPIADANGIAVRFTDVTEAAGLAAAPTWGFGAISADFNRDGWPDMYVANDAGMNRLWINQRDGTFREEGGIRGCAYNEQGTPEGSMGLALGDLDGDRDFDLVVSNLATEGASVFRNEGDGIFTETSRAAVVARPTQPHTGWGAALIDLDHDGDLDLPLVHGRVVPCERGFAPHGEETFVARNDKIADPVAYWREYADLNLLLINNGRGQFDDRTALGGDFAGAIGSGRAMIYGDIDNDGDLDLVVTNCGGRARIYRNDVPKLGRWLQVRLIDKQAQLNAYGAEVTVNAGDRQLCRVMNPADSYLASNDLRLHFGLGEVERIDSITVRWPDTTEEVFPASATNQLVVLIRGTGSPASPAAGR